MSSIDKEDDPSFLALSARLRRRIDDAFYSVASTSEVPPGGFIVEESEPGPSRYEAGGFTVEDIYQKPSNAQFYILLSEIPRALNLLDLSADDDIMGVFKNAAIGWGAQNTSHDGVGKKDWRAVCAALLEGEDVGGGDDEDPIAGEGVEMGADSGQDSDEYQLAEGRSSDTSMEASSDEYEELGTVAKVKKAPARARTSVKSSGTETSRPLTESERAQCRQEFGRFFPHIPDNELDQQRIMIKDIVRVAELLKESLKTEEIIEMLEAFSSSPDRSMNLADFERMMIVTKLV